MKEIKIDGIVYVPKSEQASETFEGLEYKIIRTESAGVHAGFLLTKEGREVTLRKARRIWYWTGAASLSQLAVDGTKKPNDCKFPCEVDKIILLQVVEIIDVTEKAKLSISEVPIWKK